jgi:hypothetical protein
MVRSRAELEADEAWVEAELGTATSARMSGNSFRVDRAFTLQRGRVCEATSRGS